MSDRSLYVTRSQQHGWTPDGKWVPLETLAAHCDTGDLVEQWGQDVMAAAAERDQRRLESLYQLEASV